MQTTINFTHYPANDGIHRHVYFNEYKRPDTIWVNTWQVVKGFAAVLALVALYVAFAWLEG